MAAISWKTASSAFWSVTTAWSTGTVPTALDDVTIAATGGSYKVTNSGTAAAKSLTLNSANATLDNAGTLTLGSSGVLGTLAVTLGTLVVDAGGPSLTPPSRSGPAAS